jgi:hypothetical protein
LIEREQPTGRDPRILHGCCSIDAAVRVLSGRKVARVSEVEHFDFSFDPRYRSVARIFDITPSTSWVEVGDERLEARFGAWRVLTSRANVVDAVITGPYAFWKTAGPARLAVTDRGLTFATTGTQGVLITFARPVRGLDPFGLVRHPELTVTVRETTRLVALLTERTSRAA